MDASSRGNPKARPHKMRIRQDQGCRKEPFMKQALLAIKIGKDRIEQHCALNNGLLNGYPFISTDYQRNGIHRQRILITIGQVSDVICDALRLDELLACLPASADLTKTHPAELDEKLPPVTPWKS